jgi:hypothetical protein
MDYIHRCRELSHASRTHPNIDAMDAHHIFARSIPGVVTCAMVDPPIVGHGYHAHNHRDLDAITCLVGGSIPLVCRASTLPEVRCISSPFSSQSRAKRRVSWKRTPFLIDSLQPSTNSDGAYWILGSSWIKFAVTDCFYGLSTRVSAEAASLEKAVSYQVLKFCTGCVGPRNPT